MDRVRVRPRASAPAHGRTRERARAERAQERGALLRSLRSCSTLRKTQKNSPPASATRATSIRRGAMRLGLPLLLCCATGLRDCSVRPVVCGGAGRSERREAGVSESEGSIVRSGDPHGLACPLRPRATTGGYWVPQRASSAGVAWGKGGQGRRGAAGGKEEDKRKRQAPSSSCLFLSARSFRTHRCEKWVTGELAACIGREVTGFGAG